MTRYFSNILLPPPKLNWILQMNNRQSKLLKQIEKEAVRVFWEEAFGGKTQNNNG